MRIALFSRLVFATPTSSCKDSFAADLVSLPGSGLMAAEAENNADAEEDDEAGAEADAKAVADTDADVDTDAVADTVADAAADAVAEADADAAANAHAKAVADVAANTDDAEADDAEADVADAEAEEEASIDLYLATLVQQPAQRRGERCDWSSDDDDGDSEDV